MRTSHAVMATTLERARRDGSKAAQHNYYVALTRYHGNLLWAQHNALSHTPECSLLAAIFDSPDSAGLCRRGASVSLDGDMEGR